MLSLVLGAAASGKSAYAEQLAVSFGAERYYIATMEAADDESRRRVARHRRLRQGKGFITIERALDLRGLEICPRTEEAVALLECASTLLGNELSLAKGAGERAVPAILEGVQSLLRQRLRLVVVSNDVFAGGGGSTPEMRAYLSRLGLLNRGLAELADDVAEVCCGIVLFHKRSSNGEGSGQ